MVRGSGDFMIVLTRREFLSEHEPTTGLPLKRIAMCRMSRGDLTRISAADAKSAFEISATGEALPTRPDMVFVDF
jgi:hypothetical protein